MMGREVKGVRVIWSGVLMMGLLEFCWVVVVEVVIVLVLLGPCGEEEEEEIWRRWSISESNGGEGGG
jgi:hypothetical protein